MIVIHNKDYETFTQIISKTIQCLKADANDRATYYLQRGGTDLEKDVYRYLNENSVNTIFKGNIELVSGQKFPDIVAYVNDNCAYGLEIKTTKSNHWKSTGSSIFEGTRVDNIKNIHLLFAKLSNPIEFKCRRYEDCLYDVAITHSPRYLIDMDITENESIFDKVGVKYDDLRKLDNPFTPIKKYLRQKLKTGEDLWWIGNNDEKVHNLEVKLWSNLEKKEKHGLRILAFAYFPTLLSNDPKKYARLATWLVAQHGIVNYALRDTFTAGGQIDIENNGILYPKIFTYIYDYINEIIDAINKIPEDDLLYYWQLNAIGKDRISEWKNRCLKHSKTWLDDEQYAQFKRFMNNHNTFN